MPRPASSHRVIGKVAYGVDGFASYGVGRFVGEAMKEETLEGGQRLCGELIIKGRSRLFLLLLWCRTKEKTSKEYQGEGSHLYLKQDSKHPGLQRLYQRAGYLPLRCLLRWQTEPRRADRGQESERDDR